MSDGVDTGYHVLVEQELTDKSVYEQLMELGS